MAFYPQFSSNKIHESKNSNSMVKKDSVLYNRHQMIISKICCQDRDAEVKMASDRENREWLFKPWSQTLRFIHLQRVYLHSENLLLN